MELVIIDVETTGLTRYDQVLQVAALKTTAPEICQVDEVFSAYCRPEFEDEAELHGFWPIAQGHIDIDDVLAGHPEDEVAALLREFVGDLPWVAYNVPFEEMFLCRSPWNLPHVVLQDPMVAATPVCRLTRRNYDQDLGVWMNEWKWPKLEEAYGCLVGDDPVLAFHDARNDVVLTQSVLHALVRGGYYEFPEEG